MEKPTIGKCYIQLLLSIPISFLLLLIFLCFDYSTFYGFTSPLSPQNKHPPMIMNKNQTNLLGTHKERSNFDPCHGRYIYIHDLPARFNYDLLKNCRSLTRGTEQPNMCPYMVNMGMGPEVGNPEGLLSRKGWFFTNQFMLEVIFHNRMKKYECLTSYSSLASAIFVPFYAGLDVSRFLWDSNLTVRDSSGNDLLQWVSTKPPWGKMWGRDHFLVAGRISWDFRRQFDTSSYWGSKFRFFPESNNITMLSVEASSWNNDYAIPYPTFFHPSKESEISQWKSKIRHHKRPNLFTFAGSPRPEVENSIRGKIIDQCRNSSACNFVDCSSGGNSCDNPVNVMSVFLKSTYCLQPPGDSYTRRSIFDSMLAGCIPVFFHPGSAYSQYKWYLPNNRTKYSVYIPVRDVKGWEVNLEGVLMGIPKDEESKLREEVIRVISSIVYADPRSKRKDFVDAFDLAVKGVLERVEEVKKVMREGGDPSVGFADPNHYKFTFS